MPTEQHCTVRTISSKNNNKQRSRWITAGNCRLAITVEVGRGWGWRKQLTAGVAAEAEPTVFKERKKTRVLKNGPPHVTPVCRPSCSASRNR